MVKTIGYVSVIATQFINRVAMTDSVALGFNPMY